MAKFFENIRFYLDDPLTGRMKVKFVCEECGKEMDEPEQFRIQIEHNVPNYHTAQFWCNECYAKKYYTENERVFNGIYCGRSAVVK